MTVSPTDYTQIAFGPGGLILPENQELLEQIRLTPPLSPENLLKLAVFYMAYLTNEDLGKHLALVALTKLVNDPDTKDVLRATISPTVVDSWADFFEDLWDGGRDESSEPPTALIQLDVRWVEGLLIESGYEGYKRCFEGKYFAIGVGPNPASLPDEDKPDLTG